MSFWPALIAIVLNPYAVRLRHSKARAATIVMHVSVTAVLFLPLTQYVAQQAFGLYVTGPIILAFTVVAIGSAGVAGHLQVQWGTSILILILGILAFRNVDEMTPLTQSSIDVIAPVIVLALCLRIETRILLYCLAAAGFVLVVATALDSQFVQSRLVLPGVNPIWMARMGCLALLGVLFTMPTKWRSFAWAVVASLTALMWLTGSRGPFLAAWSAVVVYKALKTTGRLRILLLTVTVIVSLTSIMMLGGTGLPTRSNGEVNTEWRLSAWQQALQLWSSRPMLGYGVAVDAPALRLSDYPHNGFVELLLQAGVLGLGILVVILWLTWRQAKSAEMRAVLTAVLIFTAFSGSIWASYELWLFALIRVSTLDRSLPPGDQELTEINSSDTSPVPMATMTRSTPAPGATSP